MTVLNYKLLKKNNIDYVINCTKNKYKINENIKNFFLLMIHLVKKILNILLKI